MWMTLEILNFWWDFIWNARSINGHKFLKEWWNRQWSLCLKDMWFDQQLLSLCRPESPEGKWSEHLQRHLKTQPAHMPWSKNCLSLHSIEANTHTYKNHTCFSLFSTLNWSWQYVKSQDISCSIAAPHHICLFEGFSWMGEGVIMQSFWRSSPRR
jgi:hypothetical protein